MLSVVGTASPTAAQDLPEGAVPRGAGVEWGMLEHKVTVGGTPFTLGVRVPASWEKQVEQGILFAQAQPNPGDIGVIATVTPHRPESPSPYALPEACLALLGQSVQHPTITGLEDITFGFQKNRSAPAKLATILGAFDDGTPAHFFLFHAEVEGAIIVVFSGASERLWGPWGPVLEEIARTVVAVEPGVRLEPGQP